MKYKNHLDNGGAVVKHKNYSVASVITSDSFSQFIDRMDEFDYTNGHIPPGYEHRADLISDLFYGTPTLDWLICWFNNVSDPFQQLNVADSIRIPKIL